MTIESNDRRYLYNGNGVSTGFNGPRAFAATDVKVYLITDGVPALVSPNDYTVTGVGRRNTRIEFNAAPAAGQQVLILRDVAYDQPTDLTNQGPFLPEIHEHAFDRQVMQIQQIADEVGRAFKLPETSTANVSFDVPEPEPLALLSWNETGDRLTNTPATQFVAAATAGVQFTVNVSAGQTTVPLPGLKTPWAPQAVIYNGIFQEPSAYTYDGSGITFNEALPAGGRVVVVAVFGSPTQITESDALTFKLQSAGSVTRSVRDKLGEVVSVKDFGAVGDGVTDDTAAVQAALDAHPAVYFPAGQYLLSAKITTSGPRSLHGDGPAVSRLVWGADAATSGVEIVSGSSALTSTIRDIALETKAVAAGTALLLDYSGNIVGGTIVPRAVKHAHISGVTIKGFTGYTTDGWECGIKCVSCLGVVVEGCRINGYHAGAYGTMPSSETGIDFTGSGSPVQLVVTSTFVSVWKVGVGVADAEGVYISSCELVNVGVGVKATHTDREPLLSIIGTHIAAITSCVEVYNATQFHISGCFLYPIAPQTGAFVGVLVQGDSDGLIESNTFIRSNTTSQYTGVKLDGHHATYPVVIKGNFFSVGSSSGCVAIEATANAGNFVLERNYYPNAYTHFVNASTVKPVVHYVLASSGVAVPLTGTTSDTLLASVPLPAKSLGNNGSLRITATFSCTNNANNKYGKIRFGGKTVFAPAMANVASNTFQRVITNRGNSGSQITHAFSTANSFTPTGSDPTVLSVNTDLPQTIDFYGQLANAADTVTLESYLVEVFYAP